MTKLRDQLSGAGSLLLIIGATYAQMCSIAIPSHASAKPCPQYSEDWIQKQPAVKNAFGAFSTLDCSVIADKQPLSGLSSPLDWVSLFVVALGTNQKDALEPAITQAELNQLLILAGIYQLKQMQMIQLREAVRASDGVFTEMAKDDIINALNYIISVQSEEEKFGPDAICWWAHGVNFKETYLRIESYFAETERTTPLEKLGYSLLPGDMFVIAQCDIYRGTPDFIQLY